VIDKICFFLQVPFRRNKGLVQAVAFHPLRPCLFVATQRFVRIYNLIKQELTKKLMASCKWLSGMAIHPAGEALVVGLTTAGYCMRLQLGLLRPAIVGGLGK